MKLSVEVKELRPQRRPVEVRFSLELLGCKVHLAQGQRSLFSTTAGVIQTSIFSSFLSLALVVYHPSSEILFQLSSLLYLECLTT